MYTGSWPLILSPIQYAAQSQVAFALDHLWGDILWLLWGGFCPDNTFSNIIGLLKGVLHFLLTVIRQKYDQDEHDPTPSGSRAYSLDRSNEQQYWTGKCEKSAGRAKLEWAAKSEGKRQEKGMSRSTAGYSEVEEPSCKENPDQSLFYAQ